MLVVRLWHFQLTRSACGLKVGWRATGTDLIAAWS